MAAVKLQRRKRSKDTLAVRGSDHYFIVDAETPEVGEIEAKYHAPQLALMQAQNLALNAEEPIELHVIRRPLLGGAEHVAYRVLRVNEGTGWAVLTYTEED